MNRAVDPNTEIFPFVMDKVIDGEVKESNDTLRGKAS
jgi:hypothetical protein